MNTYQPQGLGIIPSDILLLESVVKKDNKIKLAICGSRKWTDNKELVFNILNEYKGKIDIIVSGGACGIDQMAFDFSKENGIPILIYWPNYNKYGKSAPIIRNKEIVKHCDEIICFWKDNSRGTKNDIDLACQLNKPCRIIEYPGGKEEIDFGF